MTDFDSLYRKNQPVIFSYLVKLSGDSCVAEELTQETFYKAYINFSSLRDKEKATSWLITIARNTYYAFCKERNFMVELDENTTFPEVMGEDVEDSEIAKLAIESAQELKSPYREVFILYVQGMALRDISKMYSKSESWARVTFHRAKVKVLERMRKNEL